MSVRRLVFDTNVLISASLFPKSSPGQALDKAVAIGVILVSQTTWEELEKILRRNKFKKYLSDKTIDVFLRQFLLLSEKINITEEVKICRDPKDNKFLELALSGQADCIVSGDKDLLVLHPFEGIPINSPLEFLTIS